MSLGKILMCGEHSFGPWIFRPDIGMYWRECEMHGCSACEVAQNLRTVGRSEIVGKEIHHAHVWSTYVTTADRDGLIAPPWRYNRTCACGAVLMIERVEEER